MCILYPYVHVLILVVMDSALRGQRFCVPGRREPHVLILVVMDSALRVEELNPRDFPSRVLILVVMDSALRADESIHPAPP